MCYMRIAERNSAAKIGRDTMNALAPDAFSDRLPSEIEIANADHLRFIIASAYSEDAELRLNLAREDGTVQPVTLMPAIAKTFIEVLRLISAGQGFRMIPVSAELTTQEAADLLNVSRPYLIKLLEQKDIPHTKVGRHRRIKAQDLFNYKSKRDADRDKALSDMAALDAELGLI
jgi:excisionase family DNA binding protein